MNETKHTPGPWKVNTLAGRPNREVFTAAFSPYPNTLICDCGSSNVEMSQQEIEANAILIASAPDLLEACLMAKEYLISDLVEPGRTVFWKLIDAIKKAEGRS